jgi:hypothetical protein
MFHRNLQGLGSKDLYLANKLTPSSSQGNYIAIITGLFLKGTTQTLCQAVLVDERIRPEVLQEFIPT